MTRVAIVTPYHKETQELLWRCLYSVREQTVAADHFLVADGYPQEWIAREQVRHIKLDRAHEDAGNAARGIGALLAIAERYDAIGMLDADNWLEPEHVNACLNATVTPCDCVIAMRTLRRPDESVMALAETWPFDTNCLFFLRGAFDILPQWAMIPKERALVGDRLFYNILQRHNLRMGYTAHPTVNYHNLWAASYRALGEPLPEGAKENVR
jgi:glycosyltransferase involved in cell wall biosynthesis